MGHFDLREDFVRDVVDRVGGLPWCCPYHRALAIAMAITQLAEEMANPRPCITCGAQENIEVIRFDVVGDNPQEQNVQILVHALCSECYRTKTPADIEQAKMEQLSRLMGGSGEVH